MSLDTYSMPKAGRLDLRYLGGGEFVVVDSDGRQLSTPQKRAVAETTRDKKQAALDAKAKRGPRACMCCRATFMSDGIHHRLCDRCRRGGDALGDPQRPYIGRKAG